MSLSNSPVPIPPPASPIDTRSANSVAVWMEGRKKSGNLRRCANLGIGFFDWFQDTPRGPVVSKKVFFPSCQKHSFDWSYKGLTDAQQRDDLEFRLHQNPISCPANCLYYRNKYWARFTILCRRFWTFATLPLSWFSKAAWQTEKFLSLEQLR